MTTDFTKLDTDIATYIESHELAPRTLETYAYHWDRWIQFCEERGLPGLGAPWEAYEQFWLECVNRRMMPSPRRTPSTDAETDVEPSGTQHATPISMSGIDQALAAITWGHKKEGLTPTFQQPEYATLHTQVRAGYQRKYAPTDRKSAKPLRPNDVRALNSYDPTPGSPRQALIIAAAFLSLDRGWTWTQIRHFTSAHVKPSTRKHTTSGRPMTVTDPVTNKRTTIGCACGPVAKAGPLSALPRVCLACILCALHTYAPAPAPLPNFSWTDHLERLPRALQHITTAPGDKLHDRAITYSGPPDEWAYTGTRLALIETLRNGLPIRSAQARMSISWPIGLRSNSDSLHLQRRHITIQPNGSLRIWLPQSKGDQNKTGTHFEIPHTPTLTNTVGRVIQWTAIVDALTCTGPDAPLFPTLKASTPPNLRKARTDTSASSDFNRLQTAVELTGFSLHSTRTGFAVTAAEKGHSQLDLQDAMRLKQTRDLIRYTREAHTLRGTPGEQLIQGLIRQETP